MTRITELKTKKWFTVWDGVLLAALALLSVLALLLFPKAEGGIADVYVGDQLVQSMSLSVNATYTVQTENGYNVVTVENGKVFVSDADCADKTCVKTGKTSQEGGTICCLPHGVKVVVRGESGVDG